MRIGTIVIFFCLLLSKAHSQTIKEWFQLFTEKKPMLPYYPEGIDSMAVDTKNDFLFIADYDDSLGYREIKFTSFQPTNGLKIFGYEVYQPGGDADDFYQTKFYLYDQDVWFDVTDEVFPDILLYDFFKQSKEKIPEAYQYAVVEFELPRTGTTVMGRLHPFSDVDRSSLFPDINLYHHYFEKMKNLTVPLYWNKKTGKFQKQPL